VLARRKALESLLASGTSSGANADRLAFMARFDLLPEFFDVVAVRIAQLTLDRFQAFVASELAIDHQVFGAFGDENAVAAAVSAEGVRAVAEQIAVSSDTSLSRLRRVVIYARRWR